MISLSPARYHAAPIVIALLAAFALSTAVVPSPAAAKGTVRVQGADGTVHVYPGATLATNPDHTVLRVTSADKEGVLTVDQGACSYVGDILRCLLGDVTLDQHGATRSLHLEQGTIYANLTNAPLTLPRSSEIVPPSGVVMALRTAAGTYIALHGTIDEVTK